MFLEIELCDAARPRLHVISFDDRIELIPVRPMSQMKGFLRGYDPSFEREDGAAPGRFEIALGKAYGVVMTGMPGSVLHARAEQQAYFIDALNGAYNGKMVAVPGGILIRDRQGRVIGSVGVTGDTSENDAEAGMAGVEAANLTGEA